MDNQDIDKSTLNNTIIFEISIMIFLAFSWIFLYFFAKSIRKLGIPRTHDLEKIKNLIINQQ